jgi:hypothetical protein
MRVLSLQGGRKCGYFCCIRRSTAEELKIYPGYILFGGEVCRMETIAGAGSGRPGAFPAHATPTSWGNAMKRFISRGFTPAASAFFPVGGLTKLLRCPVLSHSHPYPSPGVSREQLTEPFAPTHTFCHADTPFCPAVRIVTIGFLA